MLRNRPVVDPTAPAGSRWAARHGQIILADGLAALPTALLFWATSGMLRGLTPV